MGSHRLIHRRATNLLSLGTACLWISVGACGGDAGDTPVGPEDLESGKVSRVWIIPDEKLFGMLGVTMRYAGGAFAADDSLVYGMRDDAGHFSWSSSDPEVATVEGGVVTSVGEGTATITATVEGVTDNVTVTVADRARFAWSVPIPGGISSGNVMGADGTIYVGSDDIARDTTTWYAVSPQGSILWTLDLPLTRFQTPAIGADGTLYLGSTLARTGPSSRPDEGRLIAVDPGGTVRWTRKVLDEIRSSPALARDGTIYVAAGHHLYAVDPRGEMRWTYEPAGDLFGLSSPAVASDGTIYVGGEGGLLAINPDGSLMWTFETGWGIQTSPSIGTDGTIYFGSRGRLWAVHPDGTERWSLGLNCPEGPEECRSVESSPSIGADGTIYAQSHGLFAVDPGGSIRWRALGVGRDSNTPILGADGTVYVAGRAPPGRPGIYPFDSQGRRLGDYPKAGAGEVPLVSPIIGLDGSIIVAAGDELVAIVEHNPTNGGFAASPWPQRRGDRANSGRAGG